MSQSLSLFQTLSELWARGQEPCEPISLSFERALSCEQEPWEPLLSRVWALSWEIGSQDPGTLYATLPSINECFQFSLKLWLIPFVTPDQMQCGLAYALIGHDKYLVVWSYISLPLPILPRTEHIVLGWLCVPPVFPSMHPLTHFAIQAWGGGKMRCQNIIICLFLLLHPRRILSSKVVWRKYQNMPLKCPHEVCSEDETHISPKL